MAWRSCTRATAFLLCAALTACAAAPAGRAHAERSLSVGGKPSVVLLSGYGVAASSWEPLARRLAPHATVFAFERPGYGGTPLAPTDKDGVRTSEEVAALLSQALEANKVREPFVLIAHSLSGQYALRYAKLHPDKVAALVLLDGRMKGYTAACAAVASGCSPPPITSDMLAHLAAEARGMPGIEAVMPEPEDLGALPITVISRGRGPQPQLGVWRRTQEAFSTRLKNGRFVSAETSGHFVQSDQLDLVTAEILRTLARPAQER